MALTDAQKRNFMSAGGSLVLPSPDGSVDTIDRATYVEWLYGLTVVTPPGPEIRVSGFGGILVDENGGIQLSSIGGIVCKEDGGIKIGFSRPGTILFDPHART